MILGIDSSMPLMSVALVDGARTLAAAAVRGEASRNEKLLPAVDWLLREAGAVIGDVDLYAVTRGPGSFTGLRIGLATVQGIARASGRPICAVSTLHAASWDDARGSVLVVSDAGRGELYAAAYEDGREILAPAVITSEEFERRAPGYARMLDLRASGDDINVALRAARLAGQLQERDELSLFSAAIPLYVRLAEPEAKLAAR